MLPDPNKDGVEHINVYSKGRTQLGRLLSNFAFTPTEINGLMFNSLEAYWYWLSTGKQHDHLRALVGWAAKEEGRKFPVVPCENFEDLIRGAMGEKLRQHPEIKELLKQSLLPFEHYYVFGNPPVVRDAGFKWILAEWERLRWT